MPPRAFFVLFILSAAVALSAAIASFGPVRVFSWWNIPVMHPPFADLLVVTSGAECFAHHLDPFYCNPFDSEGRRLNYPRVWQWLGFFGVRSKHTVPLGVALVTTYLATTALALPLNSLRQAVWLSVCLLSPACVFAIERGNVDMFIFVILALALVSVRCWPLPLFLTYLAVVMKLFPLAAVVLFLRYPPRRALFSCLTVICATLLYLLIIRNDLPLISAATPRGASQSYGIHVFWTQVYNASSSLGLCAKFLTYVAIAGVILGAAVLPTIITSPNVAGGEELDAFRVGAAVYCGTFLLGNNWDYRLIFLLFAVPQLVTWLRHHHSAQRRITWIAFLTLNITLWHFLIARLMRGLPYGVYLSSTLDELANWILFASLLFLLSLSLPSWIVQPLRRHILAIRPRASAATAPAT